MNVTVTNPVTTIYEAHSVSNETRCVGAVEYQLE